MLMKLENFIIPIVSIFVSYFLFFMLLGFQFYNPFATINSILWVGGVALVLYSSSFFGGKE